MSFIIHGLPRSRTAWLSHWLAYNGAAVGHDLAIEAGTVQGLLDAIHPLAGTVETGAMRGWKLLKLAMPDAKVVTIRRPVADVAASLAALGITGVDDELAERDRLLDEIEAAGAARIGYAELDDVQVCSALFECLTGQPFDFKWWQAHHVTNIQLDMPARLARLHARHDATAGLKAEAAALTARLDAGEPLQFVRFAGEPFAPFWAEAEPLAAAHYAEVNAGSRQHQPLRMNVPLVLAAEAAGAFRVHTARVNGKLAAYCTWSLSPDAECEGVTLADQGGWYVSPDPAFRRLHLGAGVLRHSIAALKAEGVRSLHLHHQLNGRGAKAGALFRRMGAQPLQHRYALWTGD